MTGQEPPVTDAGHGGGLYLYQSNRLEKLSERLGRLIHEKRRHEGFDLRPDVVLVGNYEMAQWVSARIAEDQGICANVEFRLAGSWIWQLAGMLEEGQAPSETGGASDVVTRAQLKWMAYALLRRFTLGEVEWPEQFDQLARYVKGSRGIEGLYPLSRQLADVFDRYMNYRYDMLLSWEAGSGNEGDRSWQPLFWKMLQQEARGRFKATRLKQLIDLLKGESGCRVPVPPRLYIFGLSYLPPLHLDVLEGLSRWCSIHIFHLSPSRHYWLDIVSERKRLKLGQFLDEETVELLFPQGNRLLASLGGAGRQFLARLYSLDFASGEELFIPSEAKGLLGVVQRSILELDNGQGQWPGNSRASAQAMEFTDGSIQIHSCHSRMREVEVLHDRLVQLFLEDPELKPHHVLVMAPDITIYAPYIKAVFGSAPENRQIPWAIGDVSAGSSSPEAAAFIALVRVLRGDFSAPEIMDLLSMPPVARRLDLDEDGLAVLREWVRQGGIRRGLFTLSEKCPFYQNTWLFGLERLMSTASMDWTAGEGRFPEPSAGLEVMPIEQTIEGSQMEVLAALSSFIFTLLRFRKRVEEVEGQGGLSPRGWLLLFTDMVQGLISADLDDDAVQGSLIGPISEMCSQMEGAGVDICDFSTMKAALEDEFSRPGPPRAFLSGRLLFSSLVPMRTIPSEVICLLGMNQGEFPRHKSRPSYDLMPKKPRIGDPVARDEDRYLFLETLLSARKRLIISYVGKTDQDNQELAPSSVVSELIEFVEDAIGAIGKADKESLVIQHPLQPFGRIYLTGREPALTTYALEWLPIEERADGFHLIKKRPPEPFCPFEKGLDVAGEDGPFEVTPEEFAWFFSHPVRSFLREGMGLDLEVTDEPLLDHEPFSVGWDVDRNVVSQLFRAVVLNARDDEFKRKIERLERGLVLSGLLPPGCLGVAAWKRRLENDYMKIVSLISGNWTPLREEELSHTKDLGGVEISISGKIGWLHEDGGLVEAAAFLSEGRKVAFWMKHLLFAAGFDHDGPSGPSLGVAPNARVEFMGIARDEASMWLDKALTHFLQGRSRPIPFFPRLSYAFSKAVQKAPSKKKSGQEVRLQDFESLDEGQIAKALDKAIKAFDSAAYSGGYKEPWLPYLLRGSRRLLMEVLRSEAFMKTAVELCGPMFFRMRVGR